MKCFPKSTVLLTFAFLAVSCATKTGTNSTEENTFTGAENEVKIMTLDPGHFHAALVQKNMYKQVDPTVYVFAPEGSDVNMHLDRIDSYNRRAENPTSWTEKVYTGPDYLEKMLSDKPGNVMVTAGNNAKKTDYILKSVEAGINVLADKPMVINPDEFPKLEKAFQVAQEKGVLLYDIMTERYEITTMLQRECCQKCLERWKKEARKTRPSQKRVCTTFLNMFREFLCNAPTGILIPGSKEKGLWM